MPAGTRIASAYVDLDYDLGAFRKSAAAAKAEAATLGAQIKSALSDPRGFAGTSSIAKLIADIRVGHGLLTSLKANLPGIGRELAGLSVKGLTSGLQQVGSLGTKVFGSLKSLAGSVFKGFAVGLGIGAFLSLEQVISRIVKAIPDLITKGRDYANEVDQIVDVTGAQSEAASVLASTLNFLGQDVSTVFIRLGQLSKTAQTNEKELNTLGVATRDANGAFVDQVVLLDNIRSAFSKLPDGIKKTRLEVLLFGGRGGLGQLVDYLSLTDEQMGSLTSHFQEQGLVISDEQRKIGEEALRAGKDVDNAFTGLATQLFSIVGPQIVAFLSSVATAISEHAKEITDFVSGVINTILGLFEGLTGIAPEFDSVTHSVENMSASGSDSSFKLGELNTQLDNLKKQLKSNASPAADFNAGITAGVAAIDAQIKAIDKSIGRINKLAATELDAYRKINGVLQDKIDLETEALDAEDRRINREQTAASLLRDQAQAYIDLADARAQYQKDLADPEHDQGTLDRDVIAIADAAQKVRDVQQDISNNVRHIAAEDRKVQIEQLKAYVKSVEDIVTQSENKKAALTTLTKRKAKLEEEIAAATAKGATQEVTDLRVKLAAVEAGITEENKQIKLGAEVSELDARKISLAAQKDALQAERQSEAEINRAATQKAIALKEAEIAAEKKRIAEALKHSQDQQAANLELAGDFKRHFDKGGTIPSAFSASLQAGKDAAEGIKKAFGDLATFLFGEEQQGPTKSGGQSFRSGGFLGLLGGITEAFGTIASGVGDIISGMAKFQPKDIGLGIAAAGVYFKNPYIIGAGLALLGYAVGAEQGAKIGAATQAGDFNASLGGGPPNKEPDSRAGDQARANIYELTQGSWSGDPNGPYPWNSKETNAHALARLTAELASGKFSNRGYAMGGWAGLNGPELSWLGERGPEYVNAAGTGTGGPMPAAPAGYRYALVRVESSDAGLLDWIDGGLDRRRRR